MAENDDRREAYLGKTRAEVSALTDAGLVMSGNAFSQILLMKGDLDAGELDAGAEGARLLSGADGDALRAALGALGYAPEDWAGLAAVLDDGLTRPSCDLVRLAVATLDPATIVACDESAADVLREAYADELSAIADLDEAMLAPGHVADVLGMRVMNLGGFEAALDDAKAKQAMWARLKRLPPLAEPF
ncbi:MAG: hypothetical protein LKI25_06040 [Atopobiaceae bacterium]|jgi:hypothetical protein|nr:hypothetical protein [Atopobiaceae bacterium]MCI2173757.1 hypothetical protein [Atopobiaceae bacterium]MCI2207601.1 hypothetical protein [Atopobiaceae bacterium]